MPKQKMPVGVDGQKPSVPKTVFVTGAGGFIGRALLQRYRDLGCEVRGMDFQADPERNIIAGDLMRPHAWASHAKGCDLFIHAASVVSLSADWSQYRTISVDGTRKALDVAIAGGAKRFVHFSSIAALGYDYPAGADERTSVVIGPDYGYGVGKGASEHVVLAAHAAGEIDCTIIRPGDVYGPGSRAWLLEPLHMARRGRLLLPDGGKGTFTPVYVDDLLDGVMLAAGLAVASGQIFILWGNEPVSCRDFFVHHWRWAGRKGTPPTLPLQSLILLTRVVRQFNRLFRIRDETAPDAMLMFARPGGYGTEKARQLLGYLPKIGLEEGMRRSEAWLLEIGEHVHEQG